MIRQADADALAAIDDARARGAGVTRILFSPHDPREDVEQLVDEVASQVPGQAAGELLEDRLQVAVPVLFDPQRHLRKFG